MLLDHEEPNVSVPVKRLTQTWVSLLRKSYRWKKEQFQDDADDIMLFFNGCKDDFWKTDYSTGKRGFLSADSKIAPPDFQMKVMKVAEGVEIMGPVLYSNNPKVAVNPKKWTEVSPIALGIPPEVLAPPQPLPDGSMPQPHPMALAYEQSQRQRDANKEIRRTHAALYRDILDYEMRELDMQSHMRRIIDEALICGMGVGWVEAYQFPDTDRKLCGVFYDSIQNLLLDPDAECWEDLQWIARRRDLPYWEVEDMFGYPRGSLKKYCNLETIVQQSAKEAESGDFEKRGVTADLITFHEVYTKCGVGSFLKGSDDDVKEYKAFSEDVLGKYCYMAICDKIPHPLNWRPDMLDAPPEVIADATKWPIKFCADNRWPCVPVMFHPVPGQVWPMSHFKPALGEIQWLTWCFSFMANKVRTSCGTLVGVLSVAREKVEEQLEKPGDNKILFLDDAYGVKDIRQLITYLQQPEFHQDLWNMMQAMMAEVDKRLGLPEVLYGMGGRTQDRSATESNNKNNNARGRISDMGNAVEWALGQMVRSLAIANWTVVTGDDVSEIVGPEGTMVWDQQVKTQPLDRVCREYDFEIVAGSTRRLDKQAKADLTNQMMQVLGPALQTFATQGLFGPWNALVYDLCVANDIEDPERYLVQPPPPQPDPKVEAEMQKMQMESQQQQEKHQMDMQKSVFDMESKKQQMAAEAERERMKLAMEVEKQRTQLAIMREKARLELEIERTKAMQAIRIEQVKAESQQSIEAQRAEQQIATDEKMADAKLDQAKKMGDTQVAVAKAKAKAAPKKKSNEGN